MLSIKKGLFCREISTFKHDSDARPTLESMTHSRSLAGMGGCQEWRYGEREGERERGREIERDRERDEVL